MSDTQYERIIGKFKSQAHFVRVTGLKQTTVSSWRERGLIPVEHHERIIRKARAAKIVVAPSDFFPSDLSDEAA